jgi:subtilisin family serine protease
MIKKLFKVGIALTLLGNIAQAQTKAETQKIVNSYDKVAVQELTELVNRIEAEQLRAAKAIADQRGLPYKYTDERGEPVILTGVDFTGELIYTTTHNFLGARTISADQLYNGGALGLNIQGSGITAGIWDGGYVRQSHQAVLGRVTYGEPNKSTSGHGTHVGGTMISSGAGNLLTRGVAFEGSLISYEFDNDITEMNLAASMGMIISNHSYGRQVTTSTPISVFGKYDQLAQLFDAVTNIFDFYLPVVSAGNDRNSGLNTTKNGYDLLTDRTLSKNSMVVGAVNNVSNYSGPNSVVMSGFSSFGPTDDGRIKPDIVAKGVGVLSLSDSSDTATATLQGTSMSSPMVSGGLMLLQQLYNQQQGAFMKAYSVKGLALLNTKEAGVADGPDYEFGWGLMDVAAAAQHITNLGDTSVIDERQLTTGSTYTTTVTSNGALLKVGICWNDPAGTIPGNSVDDPQPTLVNDLDIKLTDANGNDYFPWKLNASTPSAAATKGVNNVDNVEIVEIQAPSGTYTITVSHKNSLSGGLENYALLINGADTGTLSTATQELNNFVMYPNPAQSEVTVSFSNSLEGSNIAVEIFDVLGQRVSSTKFDNSGRFDQRIDVSALKTGIYLVRVGDGNVSSTRKLVIN